MAPRMPDVGMFCSWDMPGMPRSGPAGSNGRFCRWATRSAAAPSRLVPPHRASARHRTRESLRPATPSPPHAPSSSPPHRANVGRPHPNAIDRRL